MLKFKFEIGDIVRIGQPPETKDFVIKTKPDAGRYCVVEDENGNQHTVYLGRWATFVEPGEENMGDKANA